MKKDSASLFKKILSFSLKFGLSAAAAGIIIHKADLGLIWRDLHRVPLPYIICAFIVLNTGQAASALRMRFYFSSAGLHLKHKYALTLYFVGNFFNLILPGGIGGDGYKAYLMKRLKNFPVTTGLRLILSNRANGLLLLIDITLIICLMSQSLMEKIPYPVILIISAFIITTVSYSIIARFLLKEKLKIQYGAAIYSFAVQMLVVLTAWLLFTGAGIKTDMKDYLILFMISSIVSVLPISIGGIGLRELTFFKGAPLLGLDGEMGIAICIIYFVINSVSSFFGIFLLDKLKKMD